MGRRRDWWHPSTIHPWAKLPCPTTDEVLSAWEHRGDSQKDFIWLLSVLSELTCYYPAILRQKGGYGNIAGRAAGLKGYLQREIPALAPKYKSISRYAALALRLRKAFTYFPPATLALLHPDLPHPDDVAKPRILWYARTLYSKYFANLPPTYAAFKKVVDERMKEKIAAHKQFEHPWGQALPQDQWAAAERRWRSVIF